MSLIEEYSQQYDWRAWPIIFDALPDLDGRLVLDLGCGIGDLAADLAARGARVIGVDMNDELITYAKERHIVNAQFRIGDLRTFRDPHIRADGIWSSFAAAYFPSPCDTIGSWLVHLRPGGWLALTEVDDLFGHQPLSNRTHELLNRYVEESLERSRYDFRMGRKLSGVLQQIGLVVTHEFTVPDAELSFSGPASPLVLEAWRTRFERMHLLREFCGSEFEHVRNNFLNCLKRDDHSCHATVRCCIASKKET
ncbi:MAG: methyltransferase domain-containing protein [Planctomycetota bacterium]|nr:MAG: methyltransferase domain-containing protein [Planctomycetota bacterium]REK30689.1 MAG: methyltransferase domain-containing protein [Planctomycetota bacterium]REK33064.1 MAG: methyltransferase domain-containing protein [Planctomycetota bacterium]